MAFLHSASTNIHRLHHYIYADSTARLAATGFTSADIGKRAYQQSDKTFWDVRDVVAGVPTWVAGSTTISTTDDVPEGSSNLYFTESRVRSTVLTGLSLATNAAITASNTILEALGLLQKQITDLSSNKQDNITLTTTGTSGAATLVGATLNIPNYASSGNGVNIAMNDQMRGTTPTLVGSLRLPAASYTPSAMIGSGNPAYITSLLFKNGATTIDTIGGSVGGISWQTGSGFTLSITTDVDLYLVTNNASATAYLRSLKL